MSFTVYQVRLPDPNDGRGSIDGGLFSSKEAANRRAKDGNVCGGPVPGNVIEVPVYSSYAEFQAAGVTAKKVRALQNLTREDRQALGLPEPEEF